MSIIDLFNFSNPPHFIHVRVTTKAKKERIITSEKDDGTLVYRVYVNEAPENGKANKAVISLLSKKIGLPKSSFEITHGHTIRDKIIQIDWTKGKA